MVLDAPKWYEMHQNVSLGPNGVDQVSSLRKFLTQLRGTNFCTRSACFPSSFVRQPNGPKCTQWYETHQNISLGSNGVDRVCSLRKIPTRLCGTNFCTSSAHFAQSFVRQIKRSQMHSNSKKRTKTSVLGPMRWFGCDRCEKFRRDFVAWTFALVRLVLHRVS